MSCDFSASQKKLYHSNNYGMETLHHYNTQAETLFVDNLLTLGFENRFLMV